MDFTGIAMGVDEMTVVFNSMVAMQHWLKEPLVTNHLKVMLKVLFYTS